MPMACPRTPQEVAEQAAGHQKHPVVEQGVFVGVCSNKAGHTPWGPWGVFVGEACYKIRLGDLSKAPRRHGFTWD